MDDLKERSDHLTEEEHSVIEIGVEDLGITTEKRDRSLVEKMWSDCTIGKKVLHTTLMKIWRIGRVPQFLEIRLNLFIITFEFLMR